MLDRGFAADDEARHAARAQVRRGPGRELQAVAQLLPARGCAQPDANLDLSSQYRRFRHSTLHDLLTLVFLTTFVLFPTRSLTRTSMRYSSTRLQAIRVSV